MTKYWKTITKRGAESVSLYVETSDSAIEHDLEQAPSGSLIHAVIGSSVPRAPTQRHYALAAGAFRIYCRNQRLTRHGKIAETGAIPLGLKGIPLGGTLNPLDAFAAMVLEESNPPNI